MVYLDFIKFNDFANNAFNMSLNNYIYSNQLPKTMATVFHLYFILSSHIFQTMHQINYPSTMTPNQGLVIKEGILPELSEEDITMNMMIGQGAYGDVYEATLRDREARTYRHVAVKTLKCQ